MTDPFALLAHQIETGDGVLAAFLVLLASWAVCGVAIRFRVLPRNGWGDKYGSAAWQIGLVLGLEQAYEFTRGQISHQPDVALMNAYSLLGLEWRHGFFIEYRVEQFFLHFHALMTTIDLFYVAAHVTVTIGVLVWIYTRHREHYPFVRNLMAVTTAIALTAFYLYPTAPPRFLWNYGFVDPTITNHFVAQGGAQPGSYTYNPYAAMPSIHVAYAMVASWGVFVTTRRWWIRVIAALYPVVMAAAVVISANHWLLDVAGAVVTVVLARLILLAASRLHGAVPLVWMRAVR